MSDRIVVTGASGYIGEHLVEMARTRGFDVVVLGRTRDGPAATPWRLGQPVPPQALAGASAVIHLGHDWAADRAMGASLDNINIAGTLALAAAAVAADARFVFASSLSARPHALNAYGRIKLATEEKLAGFGERAACARIGLVYGGRERGQSALLNRLTALPLLPMIGLDRMVQPIHIDELCEGLLRLATAPPAHRRTFVLAHPAPLSFARWLRLLRRARSGRRLWLVPIPVRLALFGCDMLARVPGAPKVERERILGLAGAAAMASADDLAALGLVLRDPGEVLGAEPPARRRLVREAAALLAYAAGRRIRSPQAIITLARALGRDPASRTALPALALRSPGLLRLLEPLRPSMRHGLSRRLHIAAMVAETFPPSNRPTLGSVAREALLEMMATPFRLLLGRICA